MAISAQYNVAAPDSLPARLAGHQRRHMFTAFLAAARPADSDTLLDIGATSDRDYDHSNYFEAWITAKARVTAVGIDDASFLETLYPGMTFVHADGRDLPFADGSFDHVHSSAVLEHVGGYANQVRLLRELWRVARISIFLTTPNRWFPVEFHTLLPLLHWLPPPAFRAILRRTGRTFFASEDNLNLVSRGVLFDLAREAGIPDPVINTASLAGWPTNLLLQARK